MADDLRKVLPTEAGMPERRYFRLERLVAPLLMAAAIFAYRNSLQGPFVLDDLPAIQGNRTIQTLWPPWSALSPPASSAVTGRPVVNLSLAVNYAISGLDAGSYHLFNLAMHILSALLLFGVTLRTLRTPDLQSHYSSDALGIATAVALLWVVHPLTTESVDYTIQRTELLMGLFFFLTLYCALRGFESPEKQLWTIAALGAFVLGLGSKEVIVVAPAVVLAYDSLFWSESLSDALKRHRRLYAGFAVVLGLFVLLVGTRLRSAFRGLGRHMSPWDYLLTQSGVIVHYLRLAVWPHPLAADYDGWPIATSITPVLPWLAGVFVLLALTAWGLVRRQRLAFLGVWFFLILAPTSSFRPIAVEVAAERRMYLPLAAAVALGVLGGHALLSRIKARKALGIVSVTALAIVLSIVTLRRNESYRTTLSFWRDVVAKRPDNPRAHVWLAKNLRELGSNAEALQHLTTAIRIDPSHAGAHYNLARQLAYQGFTAEAIEQVKNAIRLKPDFAPARRLLAMLRVGAGG